MVPGLLSDSSSVKSCITSYDSSCSCMITELCDVLEETFNYMTGDFLIALF